MRLQFSFNCGKAARNEQVAPSDNQCLEKEKGELSKDSAKLTNSSFLTVSQIGEKEEPLIRTGEKQCLDQNFMNSSLKCEQKCFRWYNGIIILLLDEFLSEKHVLPSKNKGKLPEGLINKLMSNAWKLAAQSARLIARVKSTGGKNQSLFLQSVPSWFCE